MKKLLIYLLLLLTINVSGQIMFPGVIASSISREEAEESTLLDGLMGYWKLDETTGPTCYDATENNLDGDNTDITYTAGGKIGRCYTFNGTSSNVALGTGICQPTDGLSLAFWIKSAGIGSTRLIASNYTYSTNWYGWAVFFTTAGYIRFQLANGAGTMYQLTTTTGLTGTTWHHIVCTWDNTSNVVYIYVDNGTPTQGEFAVNLVYHANCDLHFGTNEAETGSFYYGDLDEFSIYNRDLTSDEVAESWNGGDGITHPF